MLIQTDTDAHQPLTSQFSDLTSPVLFPPPQTLPLHGESSVPGLLQAPHSSHLHAPSRRNQEEWKTPRSRKMLMGTLTGENRVGEMEPRQTEPNLLP